MADIETLKSLLSPSEILTANDASYLADSKTWAQQRFESPALVIRPTSLETLSKVVKFLADSTLKWQVRNGGAGNASAQDVVLSMRAFWGLEFDREKEVVELGAGMLWSEYYEEMERVAPDYTVVACRTPFIGVAGSIMAGGFSWLSGEYGCTSDPANMLDAQVVKLDGEIVWASEEPDLLWGLRGAQLGLGVVTKLKLRAYPTTQAYWGGMILIPKTKENEALVARGIASMDTGHPLPKVSMFLYTISGMLASILGGQNEPMLIVHVVDGNGEAHGRRLLSWALDIPGVIDSTKVMNLRGISRLQEAAESTMGKSKAWVQAITLPRITEEIVKGAFEWHERVRGLAGSVVEECYFIFELFSMRGSSSPTSDSAWPRPKDARHIMLASGGCAADAPKEEVDQALNIAKTCLKEILGEKYEERRIAVNSLEDFNDAETIYADNWKRLVAAKRKYDPESRMESVTRINWEEAAKKLGL